MSPNAVIGFFVLVLRGWEIIYGLGVCSLPIALSMDFGWQDGGTKTGWILED